MIEKHYDIVIIGSGAGGGTVAQALAPMVRDGIRILVLEKGPRLRDDEFTGTELDMSGALYEDNGGFLTAEGTDLAFGQPAARRSFIPAPRSSPRRIRRWNVPGLDHADRRGSRMEETSIFPPSGSTRTTGSSSRCEKAVPRGATRSTKRVGAAALQPGPNAASRARTASAPQRRAPGRRGQTAPGVRIEDAPSSSGERAAGVRLRVGAGDPVRAGIAVCCGGSIGSSALLLRPASAHGSRASARASPATPRTSWWPSTHARSRTMSATPRASIWTAPRRSASSSRRACTSRSPRRRT